MFTSLSPGAIGIRATLEESLALAKEAGFQGVNANISEVTDLVDQKGLTYIQELFARFGLRAGDWGMPVDFRKDEAKWQEGLAALPHRAEVAQQLGWTRTATWILPYSDQLTFEDNLTFHADRLRPIAKILKEHGISFGLEYVGPATMRHGHTYPFIHDLVGWRQLRDAIGTGNIGLLLDAYHWYTSGGTLSELGTLRNEDIVTVHMNDAVEGVPPERQIDNIRRLPGESGVIDLTGFLQALVKLGYDGPLVVEPFSQRLREMTPPDAARTTSEALRQVLAAAGIK